MGKQIFNFKGMMRDLSVSKNPSNYAYEIRNMRITAQEDSTLLSLVTEKGNREFVIKDESNNTVTLDNIVGYCTLGKYLTLFTHKEEEGVVTDSIVRLEEVYDTASSYMKARILYTGNLGFTNDIEIDALGCYENESVQKVYWVDNIHQPRLINIMADDNERQIWNQMETPFDFIPALGFNEEVKIQKVNYNGLFAPGTLQYALTYYKRNGQQSNVFYTSPLYYTSHSNRGASPEDTVSNAFEIKVYNPDTTFDYIRVYSMLRTSQDDAPVCKRVYDIPLSSVINRYEGRRKFVDETPQPSSSTPMWQQFYFGLDAIKLLKQDNATDYYEADWNDLLYEVNGTVKKYVIPYGYYVAYPISSSWESESMPVFKMHYPKSQNDYMMVVYDFADPIAGHAVKLGYASKINDDTFEYHGEWDDVEYPEHDNNILLTEYTFAHYGIAENYVSFIDNGILGDSCSLEDIIYAGGQVLYPKTLAQKNNTLFFGNYRLKQDLIPEEKKNIIKATTIVSFGYSDTDVQKGPIGSYYTYNSQLDLSSKEITTFKGGEWYIFGLVFQNKNGQWTDVVPLYPVQNTLYPFDSNTSFKPVKVFVKLSSEMREYLKGEFVNTQVVMLDKPSTVKCQGIVCPTVFNYLRDNNSPYAMASWFYRDVESDEPADYRPQAKHNHNIRNNYSDNLFAGEIQYAQTSDVWYYNPSITAHNPYNMFVDWNILTLNSPDIEFDTISLNDVKLRIVGELPLAASTSTIDVTVLTPKNASLSSIEDASILENLVSQYGYKTGLMNYCYQDTDSNNTLTRFPIYPWHRAISLHGQGSASASETVPWYGTYKTKIFSTLRTSHKNFFIPHSTQPVFNFADVKKFNEEDGLPVLLRKGNDSLLYNGNVDMLLTSMESQQNYKWAFTDSAPTAYQTSAAPDNSVHIKYKSTSHVVGILGNNEDNTIPVLPNVTVDSTEENVINVDSSSDYLLVSIIDVSLLVRATPIRLENLLALNIRPDDYCYNEQTMFVIVTGFYDYPTEKRLARVSSVLSDTTGNYRTVALLQYDDFTYNLLRDSSIVESVATSPYSDTESGYVEAGVRENQIVNVHVKTIESNTVTYHSFKYFLYIIQIYSPYNHIKNREAIYTNYTELDSVSISATNVIETSTLSKPLELGDNPYLYLAELYVHNSVDAIQEEVLYDKNWNVSGFACTLNNNIIIAELGDTYYQRYDCLKTYPYTLEDSNQIIEIVSFMCETRENIDGRYDIYRGLKDNTILSREKFNMLNKAYTQKDNIRSYHYLDSALFDVSYFPNQIIWTKTKNYGEEIDSWTQVQLLSVLDMDGTLGIVSTLRLFNDNLLCWQSKGFSRIQYNDRNAVSTSSGIPVELANSGKVDGKNYISTQAGCDNMKSVQITPSSVYFVDSNTRDIYQYSEGLGSLSKAKGFNSYMQDGQLVINDIKTFYDPKLQDVYFRIPKGNNVECLVFNEQLKEFTSFFDYNMSFLFPLQDSIITTLEGNLYKQFDGDYLDFFGNTKDYLVEFTANENPLVDKIFTNFELRADVLNPDTAGLIPTETQHTSSANMYPFKTIRVWNEYQDTTEHIFQEMIRRGTNMSQRFRIWRGDIPRDNTRKFDRIRNMWARVRFKNTGEKIKTVLHDINIIYYQ